MSQSRDKWVGEDVIEFLDHDNRVADCSHGLDDTR